MTVEVPSREYAITKLIFIIIFVFLFFNYKIFTIPGYELSLDGVVICRGMSLIFAIYMASSLMDTLYRG